jgi:hypothetical protein
MSNKYWLGIDVDTVDFYIIPFFDLSFSISIIVFQNPAHNGLVTHNSFPNTMLLHILFTTCTEVC